MLPSATVVIFPVSALAQLLILDDVTVDASELYLDLYDALVDDAEYLQADSDVRHMLPDALVIGALGAVIVTFSNGFFGRLGQRGADWGADKVMEWARRGKQGADADALLEALSLLQPLLPLLAQSTRAERDDAVRQIAQTLHDRGFPEPAAIEVAGRVLDRLEQEVGLPEGDTR